MEGLYLNTMQTLYETPRANAEFNGDKCNAFLLNKKSMPSLLILIQHRVTWKEQERQTIKMHLTTEREISATSDTHQTGPNSCCFSVSSTGPSVFTASFNLKLLYKVCTLLRSVLMAKSCGLGCSE